MDNESDSIARRSKFGIGNISRQQASLAEETASSKKLRSIGARGERGLDDDESYESGSGALSKKLYCKWTWMITSAFVTSSRQFNGCSFVIAPQGVYI